LPIICQLKTANTNRILLGLQRSLKMKIIVTLKYKELRPLKRNLEKKTNKSILLQLLALAAILTLLFNAPASLFTGRVANASDSPISTGASVSSLLAHVAAHPRFSGSLAQSAELSANNSSAFGENVAVSNDGSTTIVAEAGSTTSLFGAVIVYTKSGNVWSQSQILTATDAANGDNFGSALAISNDDSTILVGANSKTVNGKNLVGTVYIFTKSNAMWTQTQELTVLALDNNGVSFGTSISLSSDGATALIGADSQTVNGQEWAGAAYIFTKNGTTWTQQTALTASDPAYSDFFGGSVSLSNDGSSALIGASGKTINSTKSQGAAYIFSKSGSNWNQVQKLTAADGAANDDFAFSARLSGDGIFALIGAAGHKLNQSQTAPTGAIYVFSANGSTWSQTQEFGAGDSDPIGSFGEKLSLASDGTTLLSSGMDLNSLTGAAFVFKKINNNWVEMQKLMGSDTVQYDEFATSVSISGDGSSVLVGADRHSTTRQYAGTAYSFTPSTTLCQPGAGATTTTPITSTYTYYLPFLACDSNNFTTYLAFQNTASTSATVTLQYFNAAGSQVATPTTTCTNVAAFAECIAPNPFSDGQQGTGIVYSNQPLNVIVSEATPYGGSAYPVSQGASTNLIAPLVIHNGLADFTTNLTIFNGGSSTVTGTVQFYQQNGTLVNAATKSFTLTTNTSINYDQSTDNSLGSSFYGWAQITSPTGSKLVAQVLEQSSGEHFVALANAQTTSQSTLYAPAIFHNAYGTFNTGVNIVNPNSQPVTVSITYYNKDGSASTAPAFQLAAHSLQGVYQGSGSTGTGLPTNGLSDNFAGAAVITSTGGGIVMVVNEFGGVNANGNAKSGTYSAASTVSNSIGLPVVANGGYGYTTGATIFNTSNQTISGTVQYYNPDGTTQGIGKNFSVGPYQSAALFQGDSSQGLGSGFYGTAIISENGSGKDLIVTTNAASNAFFYSFTEPNS
jgi:hypothetical protein